MQNNEEKQEPYPTDPDECRRSALAFIESFDPDEWVRSIDKTWSVDVGEKDRVGVFSLTHPVVDVAEYRKSERCDAAFINEIRPKDFDRWMERHDHVMRLCDTAIAFLKNACIESLWIRHDLARVVSAIESEEWLSAKRIANSVFKRDVESRMPTMMLSMTRGEPTHPPAWMRFSHDLDVLLQRAQVK